MKVFALFKQEMMMPFMHETLVSLHETGKGAEAAKKVLDESGDYPKIEEDEYGPVSGIKFFVAEIEVET